MEGLMNPRILCAAENSTKGPVKDEEGGGKKAERV